ncbi:TIGR02594 family protein [Burkholderia plantarii]|uniref:TIGR02594 family protein n=1 Tax=Burkholderia plantarii TaxID=41899 RepID=UPI0018DD20FB|nr:TIGR02594 family protein [Burkholderia plantarii]MBI0329495.1 TIGR02594 family protein [Burkholderia plantarii]
MTKFISATHDKATLTVQYVADNGDILLRSGGTIAWRFNNPGNLRPKSKYVLTSIGVGNTASGDFFIFPDYDTGRAEKKALLRRKYNDMSISDALQVYAPPSENNTEAYIQAICTGTGFARTRVLNTMSDADLDSMMNVMEKHEGYNARIKTRHERWIRTASVTLSDGAKPIPNQKVTVQAGAKKTVLTTNAFGQLPLLPMESAGQQIQFLVDHAKDGLKQIGQITTQNASAAYVFFQDLFQTTAPTSAHYVKDAVRREAIPGFRYRIVSGDTLGKIAQKFKVSVAQLEADNHLKSSRIFAGDYLMINAKKPHDAPAAPPNPAAVKPAATHRATAASSATASTASTPAPAASPASVASATAPAGQGQAVSIDDFAKPAGGSGTTTAPASSAPAASATPAAASTTPSATPATPAASGSSASPAASAPTADSAVVLDRSKLGQGHPVAFVPATSPQAPWMEFALQQAKFWHGQKEDVITKTINYHKEVGGSLKSLVGDSNPWCASFVNWCLQSAKYPKTAAPMDSQSFRFSKNFVKIDKPVFGAVAVYKHRKGGHAAFVYAQTSAGAPILLGGNQSDAINFGMQKASELKGFFVPATYLQFAKEELAKGTRLEVSTPAKLNEEFHIAFAKKKANADR